MNKKFRNILSLGAITMLTASSMLPVNALSKTCYKKVMTTKSVYIYVNGVKYKLPLTPSCPNVPSKPESTPNNPSTTPEQKPESTPSTPSTTPQQKPESTPSKPSTTPQQKPSTDFSSYQQQVLDLVNAERTKRGISALTLDSNLSSVATKKSQDMVNKNYFDHTSPTYGSPFDMMKQFGISYRTAGENIAKGQKTPQEVVTAWMNSEGHRKNILNPNFTNLGVGIAKDSKGTTYWTQMFIGK
ncbi:CAP domain-containing protein [Romboutsia timonensis]|uniref:CAP domain-containing protein n=1 Tax=Romboutsia timonensis TaxID=1776391 RepID=UPI002A765691|nr:CAP domain-containing protein [Romboutsia timonensis]MDY3001940.1 CAP domain-containing protein [Romboutsia timonensis]MDY3958622.1 CAP domain-containing protein [Romboutsia timonensis]